MIGLKYHNMKLLQLVGCKIVDAANAQFSLFYNRSRVLLCKLMIFCQISKASELEMLRAGNVYMVIFL